MEELYAVGWRAPGRSRQWVFAFWVLQRLARADLLKCIDYFWAVSGAGYIGGALTRLLSRTTDPGAPPGPAHSPAAPACAVSGGDEPMLLTYCQAA